MGFLSEIKKLLFGASSVAKHSAEKTGDFIKKESDELIETGKEKLTDFSEAAREKTSGLRQSIIDNSKELIDKTKDKIEHISEEPIVKKAAEISEDVGEKIIKAKDNLVEQAGELSENIGSKVLKEKDELIEKGKDLSEKVGSKVIEVKDELVQKAKESAEKIEEKFEETMDKAEAWAEAEKTKVKKDFVDEDLNTGGSLLDDSDDFFSKASKYADGDYDAFSEGKISIDTNKQNIEKPVEKASNFADLDGDGNEIIDDAIIEADNEDPASKEEE